MRNRFLQSRKELIAFVHIEKAAGTTLIHLLRSNFFMRYIDVRPLSNESNQMFTAMDMKKTLFVNPSIVCIGGHSIKPFSDLKNEFPNTKYITLLRDPVTRYISHYLYWIDKRRKKLSFEEFLAVESVSNFQVKKIAGTENLEWAKQLLSKEFLLVGLVESFDEFLILLKNKLRPFRFAPHYDIKNVGNKRSSNRKTLSDKLAKYRSEVIRRNQLDIDLYNYVKTVLLPKEKAIYGSRFNDDLKVFKNCNTGSSRKIPGYLDCLFRKCYYELITGLIRKKNGLASKGSY